MGADKPNHGRSVLERPNLGRIAAGSKRVQWSRDGNCLLHTLACCPRSPMTEARRRIVDGTRESPDVSAARAMTAFIVRRRALSERFGFGPPEPAVSQHMALEAPALVRFAGPWGKLISKSRKMRNPAAPENFTTSVCVARYKIDRGASGQEVASRKQASHIHRPLE